jgi:hypothetical protein
LRKGQQTNENKTLDDASCHACRLDESAAAGNY